MIAYMNYSKDKRKNKMEIKMNRFLDDNEAFQSFFNLEDIEMVQMAGAALNYFINRACCSNEEFEEIISRLRKTEKMYKNQKKKEMKREKQNEQ